MNARALRPRAYDESRKYDRSAAESARAKLRQFVEDSGGQEEAARLLHVNQGTISRSLKPENQPQLRVLLALRDRLRVTLDEILGLAPLSSVSLRSTSEIARLEERLKKLEAAASSKSAK